jgi:hypothetical protein
MDEKELKGFLAFFKNDENNNLAVMPSHKQLINQYCKAMPPV